MLPQGINPKLIFTWVNFEFGRNFRIGETVAVGPAAAMDETITCMECKGKDKILLIDWKIFAEDENTSRPNIFWESYLWTVICWILVNDKQTSVIWEIILV